MADAMNGVFFQEETPFNAEWTGCSYPGVGIGGGLPGWPLWKRQSLPWPQQAPTEPPPGRAETPSQDGGASRKMYVRKGKTMRTEGKNTVWQTTLQILSSQKKDIEEVLQDRGRATISLEPRERTMPESQNAEVWKGAWKVTWPNLLAQAGSPRVCNLGLCPVSFWVSPHEGNSTTFLGNLFTHTVKFPQLVEDSILEQVNIS